MMSDARSKTSFYRIADTVMKFQIKYLPSLLKKIKMGILSHLAWETGRREVLPLMNQ